MHHEPDAMARSMSEVCPVSGPFDDLARGVVNGLAAHARANALHGRFLRRPNETMDLALPCRGPSDTDGPRNVAAIAVGLCAEIYGHEVAFPDAPVRDRGMGHRPVPPRRHDGVEGGPAGAFVPHEILEPERQLPLGCAGFDELFQLPERFFRPPDCQPDMGEFMSVLAKPQFAHEVPVLPGPKTVFFQFFQELDRKRRLVKPERIHSPPFGYMTERRKKIIFLDDNRDPCGLPVRLELIPEIGDQAGSARGYEK